MKEQKRNTMSIVLRFVAFMCFGFGIECNIICDVANVYSYISLQKESKIIFI